MTTLAFYDTVTGLQNRPSLMLSFEQAIARAQRDRHPAACLFIDLNGFDSVNEAFGRVTGETVLLVVAQILRDSVRGCDIVGRLDDDEFVIVLSWIHKPSDAATVAEKIHRAVDRPIEIEGVPVQVSVNIGISLFPEDAEDAESLLQLAARATDAAKHSQNTWIAATAQHPGRKRAS
jgi:diguanylate cyclase (GGDEF)-like protein